MIDRAFLHIRGVGRKNLGKLEIAGLDDWWKVLERKDQIPFSEKFTEKFLKGVEESSIAFKKDDISFFSKNLAPTDRWRVLEKYFERITFLDIETDGLDFHSGISLIVCFHKGTLYKFLRNENLDDFLHLLSDVELLSTFNGSSFDLPVIENFFRIGKIPCPHIDLRWVAYHMGYKGGLKRIERELGIQRPLDLRGTDGFEAVILWDNWERYRDEESKRRLIRYCSADVISLGVLTEKILQEKGVYIQGKNSKFSWDLL